MNRTVRIDSKLSLDAGSGVGDSTLMLAQPYHLYVERVDPDRNMARFYALAIEPTLFGTPRLLRRWGRIGTSGRTMVHDFEREEEAVALFLDLLRERRAHGYRVKRIEALARG
ncbi:MULTISPECIES: WGR domain-containing protein [unclassified Shinella]|uniref:WGR domain-containing protein n=1 Tax=unclassified Shinella TaxID=2643062 RepID=UPI00225DA70C|nr:WGR domain-containing protein [Shinella sp. YE25]MDC7259530.1 WGR domain-containing protein [Shinella sp. YE25]CAI0341306.1 WGR domain-containing protein [Rhizobiaceae bacterium]CAK7260944.1 WGR domain-containing protein [Shinella sp. WSC3-e]